MSEKRMAIVYDVDGTLVKSYLSSVCMYEMLGINGLEYWGEFLEKSKEINVEPNLMLAFEGYKMVRKYLPKDKKLMDIIKEGTKNVVVFKGLDTWFDNLNEIAKQNGIILEHFIISSGEAHIIQEMPFAKHMKHIFATKFFLDEDGIPLAPSVYVSSTGKTEWLYRISKGVFQASNTDDLFAKKAKDERYVNWENMIYIGDGETDVPCMKLLKNKGGHPIAVYYDSEKKKQSVEKLFANNRVNFIAPADYSKNSPLFNYVVKIIKEISAKLKNEYNE